MSNYKYSMIIQWSNEDQCFLVGFPDFPEQKWRTHGDTYQEAFNNGIEALESLISAYEIMGDTLPIPSLISYQKQAA